MSTAKQISAYLASIGSKGGKKSRRKLSPADARAMAARSAEVRRQKALARAGVTPKA